MKVKTLSPNLSITPVRDSVRFFDPTSHASLAVEEPLEIRLEYWADGETAAQKYFDHDAHTGSRCGIGHWVFVHRRHHYQMG